MLSCLHKKSDGCALGDAHVKTRLVAAVFLLPMASALACGPLFPNRVTEWGDRAVLSSPIGSFYSEIERIKPPIPHEFTAVPPDDDPGSQTRDAGIADLKEALARGRLRRSQQQSIVRQFAEIRRQLLAYDDKMVSWDHTRRARSLTLEYPRPKLTLPPIPQGLPGEFDDYLRGAILYHRGEEQKAATVWQTLLKRPAAQRRYRSTWAAFMIGRSLSDSAPSLAVDSFKRVRQLTRDGFVDSLGLAASSLGWEARVYFKQGQYGRAMELYVVQMTSADDTAVASLQISSFKALRAGAEALEDVAKNDTARSVMTAYVISRGGPFREAPANIAERWLAAIEAAGVPLAHEADRLAWAAYQAGRMDMARRWLAVSPSDSVIVRWLRAKVFLREGRIEAATRLLAQLAREFPTAPDADSSDDPYGISGNYFPDATSIGTSVRAELGVLMLARQQYIESLDLLLQGDFWADAAYVAERVLSLDELKTHVDRTWPGADGGSGDGNSHGHDMRYLLARRLTRSGRWQEARPYYPAQWQTRLDVYIGAIRKAHDKTRSQSERAAFFWEAAIMARREGMDLLGTELEPDWFLHRGVYLRNAVSEIRGQAGDDSVTASSSDERRRLQNAKVTPESRFHYRHVAADHAWKATQLMPDNSKDTAYKLCLAGSWIKASHPKEADRFYKALVNRCRNTKLGQEADRLRWFPKLEE